MVLWRVLVGIYVAAVVAALVIVNVDQSDAPAAAGMVAAAALALGFGTASAWGAVVAWLLIPLALPFGDANQFAGGGTDAIVLLAVASAAISTVLILFAAGARVLYNRHRPSARAAMLQSTERNETPRLDAASPPPMGELRRIEERKSGIERIGAP